MATAQIPRPDPVPTCAGIDDPEANIPQRCAKPAVGEGCEGPACAAHLCSHRCPMRRLYAPATEAPAVEPTARCSVCGSALLRRGDRSFCGTISCERGPAAVEPPAIGEPCPTAGCSRQVHHAGGCLGADALPVARPESERVAAARAMAEALAADQAAERNEATGRALCASCGRPVVHRAGRVVYCGAGCTAEPPAIAPETPAETAAREEGAAGERLLQARLIAEARTQGYDEGFSSGREQGRRDEQTRILGLIDAIPGASEEAAVAALSWLRQAIHDESQAGSAATFLERVHQTRLSWIADGRKQGAAEEQARIVGLLRTSIQGEVDDSQECERKAKNAEAQAKSWRGMSEASHFRADGLTVMLDRLKGEG